jgi:hypothetical protein
MMRASEAQALILEYLGGGYVLSEVLQLDGMPARATVYGWLRDGGAFSEQYALAREQAADVIDEEIAKLAREVTPANATAIRTKIAALQWRAAKLNPSRYGGAASIALENNAADVPPSVDVAAIRADLMERLDEVAARIEAHERERYFVSRLINAALRELEDGRRLSPLSAADRGLILDVVRQAITPNLVPVPEGPLAAGD